MREKNAKMLSQVNYLLLTPTYGNGNLTSQIQRILFTGQPGLVRNLCQQVFYHDKANCMLIDSHPLSPDQRLRIRSNAIKGEDEKPQSVYIPLL